MRRKPVPPLRPARRFPVGAETAPRRGTDFRVWAPRREGVSVVLETATGRPVLERDLAPDGEGYFRGVLAEAGEGALYRFRLDGGERFPDPASRFQPGGPEGPSRVVDPSRFRWTDRAWRGRRLRGRVFYELHAGTFTRAGTWRAAAGRLEELAETGLDTLELMPVAEFAGAFGWGYDGVHLFAPYHGYGLPDDLRAFVDRAHGLGLGVVLDVVYNHFGTVGSSLHQFALEYFSDRQATEWGYALNFDGPGSGPVREFFAANAGYWIEEFHLDGLRLDATQSIFDRSPEPIVARVARAARERARGRNVLVVAENEPQDPGLLRPVAEGGLGLDAAWNDDAHHSAAVALTGRTEAYYEDYRGDPQELISAARFGFLFQGQRYVHQGKPRGGSALDLEPERFIAFLQNHDQVANSARGERIHRLADPGRMRAVTAYLLLAPSTPLLFQGQEFGASTPFLYFADFPERTAALVRAGRAAFLSQFQSLYDPAARAAVPDPGARATFERCKLDDRERAAASPVRALHRDLLRLRRSDPVFRRQPRPDGAVLSAEAFALRFPGAVRGDRLLVVNLGRDLVLAPAPEPLLGPPRDSHWELLWSSESPDYGGGGTPPQEPEGTWRIPGRSALVFAPRRAVWLER